MDCKNNPQKRKNKGQDTEKYGTVSGTKKPKSTSHLELEYEYPEARRDDSVVDNYNGVEVPDPYRWLENPDSEETKYFSLAQNAITASYLRSVSVKKDIHARLQQIKNTPTYSCPEKHGDKYYFFKNEVNQNQPILYVQDSVDSEPKVFFDPNTVLPQGTISIPKCRFSVDGRIFVYESSVHGSDWKKINFMNSETGERYPEVLEQVKFSLVSWTHDNLGIFYGRYPHQEETEFSTESSHNQKVYYHKIGTPQSEDVLVVEFPENPQWLISAEVSDCGKWLIVSVSTGVSGNLLYFAELKAGEEIKGKIHLTKIVEKLDADYVYMINDDTKAIFRTNENAPNWKLISIDFLNYTKENWTVLLPEHSEKILEGIMPVDNDKFIALFTQDVKDILQLHSLKTGEMLKNLPLDFGTVVGVFGEKKSSEVYFNFSSFLNPGTIYRMDVRKDENPKIYRETKVHNFDPNSYKTIQVFYPSKDGTRVPMFIVMRKDAKLDGSMPALLSGYGGYSASALPSFTSLEILFIQHLNGVYAVANIRGGGEYGEKWHSEGRLLKKQNSFDDFQCAAEYLIANGYTSNKKLTIEGQSNGGLLVGACANQRPDLFGAVIAVAGSMDMLRFHKFTIGYTWASEYGSPDDPEHFENLFGYSPLHNIKPPNDGGQYPATFVLTADRDDRVVPSHSLKYIATLQHEIGQLPQQINPLIARIVSNAGHTGGRSIPQMIEECTNILAFIVKSLDLEFVA